MILHWVKYRCLPGIHQWGEFPAQVDRVAKQIDRAPSKAIIDEAAGHRTDGVDVAFLSLK